MDSLQKIFNYVFPPVDPEIAREIDRKSMRNIYIISLFVLVFETLTLIAFLSLHLGSFGREEMISTVSVSYCILFCGLAVFLSRRMFRNRDLSRKKVIAFKVFFFIVFSVWAIFSDYRHYKVGEQMLTFYTVNLIIASFISFKPWIGVLLSGFAYLLMYLILFFFDRAAGIQLPNFLVLAFVTVACNAVHYHSHIHACERERSLTDGNKALAEASHRDGLTGLRNRLALEEDAARMDGKPMTAFMIDINYFKEMNDQYGHIVGDQLLRKTSDFLQKLFPGASYYRYGGDEFLVLSRAPAEDNYGKDTFLFTHGESGARVSLSIGSAQGEPADYDGLFELISLADKALYAVKKRVHSVEYGGHDRRKRAETPV